MISHGAWIPSEPLVLASRSLARQTLLASAQIRFETEPADIDERAIENMHLKSGRDSAEIPVLLARKKALAVSIRRPGRYILGADQTLFCDGRIFSKPDSRAKAAEQIGQMSGKWHELRSAAVLVLDDQILTTCASTARIKLRRLSNDAIDRYLSIAGKSVEGCVGSYQLEGTGVHLFEQVDGDYWTILGLPLLQLCEAMRSRGLLQV